MRLILLIIGFFVLLQTVQAQDHVHMISGGTSSAVIFQDNATQNDYDTSFETSVGYYYSMRHGFQVGADADLAITDNNNVYTLLPGVIYNLPKNGRHSLVDAVYFQLNAGVVIFDYDDDSLDSDTEFLYTFEIGKRVALASNISWAPSISFSHMPDVSNSDPDYSINLFKVDVFF